MSGPSVPWLDTKFLVEGRFDAKHIQSFGFADVGPIYMTLNTKCEIVQATAKLIDTTFKEMLIEDPEILRIFRLRGDGVSRHIDMSVLHPWPKFRLEPVNRTLDTDGDEEWDFEVGCLVNITNAPAAARFGTTSFNLGMVDPWRKRPQRTLESGVALKEGPSSVAKPNDREGDQRRPSPKPAPIRSQPEANELLPASSARRADSSSTGPTATQQQVPVASATRKRKRRGPVPNGPVGDKMQVEYDQIMATLPRAVRDTFEAFVTTGPGSEIRYDANLRDFVKRHGFVDVYNRYETLQKTGGANEKFHLPIVEDEDETADDEDEEEDDEEDDEEEEEDEVVSRPLWKTQKARERSSSDTEEEDGLSDAVEEDDADPSDAEEDGEADPNDADKDEGSDLSDAEEDRDLSSDVPEPPRKKQKTRANSDAIRDVPASRHKKQATRESTGELSDVPPPRSKKQPTRQSIVAPPSQHKNQKTRESTDELSDVPPPRRKEQTTRDRSAEDSEVRNENTRKTLLEVRIPARNPAKGATGRLNAKTLSEVRIPPPKPGGGKSRADSDPSETPQPRHKKDKIRDSSAKESEVEATKARKPLLPRPAFLRRVEEDPDLGNDEDDSELSDIPQPPRKKQKTRTSSAEESEVEVAKVRKSRQSQHAPRRLAVPKGFSKKAYGRSDPGRGAHKDAEKLPNKKKK